MPLSSMPENDCKCRCPDDSLYADDWAVLVVVMGLEWLAACLQR